MYLYLVNNFFFNFKCNTNKEKYQKAINTLGYIKISALIVYRLLFKVLIKSSKEI